MDDARFQVVITCQEDDLALVERFRAGDWGALDVLYGRYARQVFQRSWRILRRRRPALDATHDTFVLFVAHSPCKCGEPVREWLFAVAARLASRACGEQEGER